jgi:hypothetical protein
VVDKGKGKMVELEKPRKAAPFPLQTGGAFKIYERKAPTSLKSPMVPSAKKSPVPVKKPEEIPSIVARVLKLVDEKEESEVGQPAKATSRPAPKVSIPAESDVVEIAASFVKKRKLKKVAEPTALVAKSVTPMIRHVAYVIETAAPVVRAMNVGGFLATRRKQAPPPFVPRTADVEVFLDNEPVLAISVNIVVPIEEPLRAPEGPLPSILDHPLGLNI